MTTQNAKILPNQSNGSQVDPQRGLQVSPQQDEVLENELKESSKVALEAIDVLLDSYRPAADVADSTHQMDTEEIIEAVAHHTGIWLNASVVFQKLKKRGFTYGCVGGYSLCWLLKSKGGAL